MVSFLPTAIPVTKIEKWHREGTLLLSPKFQRRPIWKKKVKAYLINTMLNRLPIPKIFMRMACDPKTGKEIHEIVDGQQRLRAILEFLEGSVAAAEDEARKSLATSFNQLRERQKKGFMSYKLSVDVLKGASDKDVHDLFRRLNTYTYSLSRQEKRNGRYFGPFKRTVYSLSKETYDFWLDNKIFTPTTISRMAEAELISELLVVILDGLQDKKQGPLRTFYERFEPEGSFRQRSECVNRFTHCLSIMKDILGKELKDSEFRRRPLFYSLYCVIYDALYVMKKSGVNKSRHIIPKQNYEVIRKALNRLGDRLKEEPPKRRYLPFVQATARQTDNLGPRTTRHRFIWNAINSHFVSNT
mgnify:CR=1 FL=1